jgi:hypothetical protein
MTPAERETRSYLEPAQLVSDTSRRLPRVALGPRARAGLWVLRVFTIVLSLMVVYTFVSQLSS